MTFNEVFQTIVELSDGLPYLFQRADVRFAFGDGRPYIGDWSDPENLGLLVTGDGVGSESGVYYFGSPEGEVLYIGKATKNNLHHRVWDHLRTPEIRADGRRVFPKHGFAGDGHDSEFTMQMINGEARLGIVTISDPDLISLVEVYLQTVYRKRHGRLPVFNKQIG